MSEKLKDMCSYYSSHIKSGILIEEVDNPAIQNMTKFKENIDKYSASDEDLDDDEYNDYDEDDHYYKCPYCSAFHDSQYKLEKCIDECTS